LQTDVTGKVVRYLQDNGAMVNAGEPYVEVEAVKMIMPIKAGEAGRITHYCTCRAGTSFPLVTFSHRSNSRNHPRSRRLKPLPVNSISSKSTRAPKQICDAICWPDTAVVTVAFAGVDNLPDATKLSFSTLSEFLHVDKLFAGKRRDDVVRELAKANTIWTKTWPI
jgi:acetyl-CoA carboxylase / biotin carboxylase 1